MASTDYVSVPSKLIAGVTLSPYSSSGSSLGEVLSAIVVAFEDVITFVEPPQDAQGIEDARWWGANAVIQAVLAEHSADVINALWRESRNPSGTQIRGRGTRNRGAVLADTEYDAFLIRPNDTTLPKYFYVPRGLVLQVGSIKYEHRGEEREGAAVHILAMHDSTNGQPFYYGDPDDNENPFPTLPLP